MEENKLLKEKIKTMQSKEIGANYQVELIVVKTLQEYLKSLENNCMNLMNDGDFEIQRLKEENIKRNSN